MIQTRIVIRPTRSVRDLYRGRKYKIVARFPGGREIDKGFAQTRQRAFRQALVANAPSSSPTVNTGSGYAGRFPPGSTANWKLPVLADDAIVFTP